MVNVTTEQQKANQWFERLVPLLENRPLPCQHGPARIVSADEFMFMGEDNGIAMFKHRDTRNYIRVVRVPTGYELNVPSTMNAFFRGFFDKF